MSRLIPGVAVTMRGKGQVARVEWGAWWEERGSLLEFHKLSSKDPPASLSNLFPFYGEASNVQAIRGLSATARLRWIDKTIPVSQSLEVLKLLFLLTPKGFQATHLPFKVGWNLVQVL